MDAATNHIIETKRVRCPIVLAMVTSIDSIRSNMCRLNWFFVKKIVFPFRLQQLPSLAS